MPLWASGFPPFAFRDVATVARGGVVDRLSNGNASVLDNDFDFEQDELFAFLVRDVNNGTLLLLDDGTFIYAHDGSNGGNDSFAYRAFDGTGFSRPTFVTILIEDVPNSPPIVVADVPDQEALEDVAYRLELADNFLDPDDGDTLRFTATGLPVSNSLRLDANTGVLSGTPGASDVRAAPYVVEITATDRAGASARLTFQLTIFAARRADLALDVSLVENPVNVGETAQWIIEVDNRGPGNYDDAAQLDGTWTTSGPTLSLATTGPCTISGNGTGSPAMSCSIGSIAAGSSLVIQVDATQSSDGESTLIGVLNVDDPIPGNNTDLASSQVVSELSEGPTQVVDVSGNGVDAGDLDGDGEIDIVATDGQTLVFFNDGNRSVRTPGTSLGPGSGGAAVALLDWNGDGFLDIAVGGLSSASAEIFVNDGNGGFDSADRLLGSSVGNVNDIAAADLTGNGRSELILAGSADTVVMHSRDNGGFDQTSLSSGAGLDLDVGDADADGDQDVIVVRQIDRRVDIHYNSGNGTSFSRIRSDYGSASTARSDDLNEDGLPDLLIGLDGDDLNPPETRLFLQQADGSFAAGGSFGAAPISALLSGDVDADGWHDVVAVNEAGVHQVYLGSGGAGFSLAAEQIVSGGMRRGVLSDFNSDQSLDLIMVGPGASVLEIHANNGLGRLGLGDRIPPNLQLVGERTVDIAAGETFVDPGATAVDDIDGDITEQIEIQGVIDPNRIGTQTITYRVTDRADNLSSAVRTVNVGINSGRGGGGGGATTPIFIIALGALAALRRKHRRASWSG